MKYLFPFFICALFASCFNEGDCLITATNYVHIQFKKINDTSQDTLVSFSYHSVEIDGQTSAINYGSATEILLPLNTAQDSVSTTYIFHRIKYTDSTNVYATDTIRLGYTKQTKIISKDCGAFTFYKNLGVLKLTTTGANLKIDTLNRSALKDPTGAVNSPKSYALNFQIFY